MKTLNVYLWITLVGVLGALSCSTSNKLFVEEISRSDLALPDWMKTIESKSLVRTPQRNFLDFSVSELTEMDTELLKTHLMNFKVSNYDDWVLEYESYAIYHFLDFKEFDDFILFTIHMNNESGYRYVYQYTFDKANSHISSVSLISMYGVDGGGKDDDVLTFLEDGKKLRRTTSSSYDFDMDVPYQHCYSRSFDSIITSYHFLMDRTIQKTDTVFSIRDTICRN